MKKNIYLISSAGMWIKFFMLNKIFFPAFLVMIFSLYTAAALAEDVTVTSPRNGSFLTVGYPLVVSWTTPERVALNHPSVKLLAWQGNRFKPIALVRNQAEENTYRGRVLGRVFEPGKQYRIKIINSATGALLGQSGIFTVHANSSHPNAPRPTQGSGDGIGNDLELGPIYAEDLSLRRVSGNVGEDRLIKDTYLVTINFRIRNNTVAPGGGPMPDITSVPCKYQVYKLHKKNIGGERINSGKGGLNRFIEVPGAYGTGTIQLGPFRTMDRSGQWGRCRKSIRIPLDELYDGELVHYYVSFELKPAAVLRERNPNNNTTKTRWFKKP